MVSAVVPATQGWPAVLKRFFPPLAVSGVPRQGEPHRWRAPHLYHLGVHGTASPWPCFGHGGRAPWWWTQRCSPSPYGLASDTVLRARVCRRSEWNCLVLLLGSDVQRWRSVVERMTTACTNGGGRVVLTGSGEDEGWRGCVGSRPCRAGAVQGEQQRRCSCPGRRLRLRRRHSSATAVSSSAFRLLPSPLSLLLFGLAMVWTG